MHGDAARGAAALLRWRTAVAARAAPRVARCHVLRRPLLIRRGHRSVAEPNPPMHRTRTRALRCCEMLVHRVRSAPVIGGLGSCSSWPHGPPPCPVANFDPRECRGPRVLAASGVSAAERSAASVRFTPARAPSLSPRRAPLCRRFPHPPPSAGRPAAALRPARPRRGCTSSRRRDRTRGHRNLDPNGRTERDGELDL